MMLWPSAYTQPSLVGHCVGLLSCRFRTSRPVLACAALGIDLGTTNSAVAAIVAGQPHALGTAPSCVAFTEADDLCGSKAQRQATINPLNTFSSVKRLIGQQYSEVRAELEHASYESRRADDGGVQLWCPARGIALSPEEISAQILRHLISQAEDALATAADAAVIAVPAHFGAAQRAATLEAGRLAGVSRLQLLQEPIAASLAYGLGRARGEDALILVFDLGGGTFDVSLVECFEGCLEVLATGGDAHLGGDDWDRALQAWVLAQQPHSPAERREPADMLRLADAVEAAKRTLSEAESASIRLPSWGSGGGVLHADVTRTQFEEATAALRARLGPPLERLGREACLEWAQRPDGCSDPADTHQQPPTGAGRFAPAPRRVSQVVLVGGATRMPAVREFVRRITGIQPHVRTTVDPALAVSLGAAIYGGMLEGTVEDGVELADGAYSWALHERASGFPT